MNEEYVNEYKDLERSDERIDRGFAHDYILKNTNNSSTRHYKNDYNMEVSSEFLSSNAEVLRAFKNLDYADLGDNQEKRMRELERQFNEEFGTDFYFMVMKEEKK